MKLTILWTLTVLAYACARTTVKQPAITAHITSLNDKDNRRKAMEHAAFANAGRQAGLEIWRIEDFEPVPVPTSDHRKFYKGDSYIVLKTTADKKNNLSWDIHYWLGSQTSQDEAGAAAILTVGLDDKFNGAAVQHRETEGHESPQFLGYFQPAIIYLDGGHATGFSHVTTNAGAEKRLFQIKGKRNVRVRQVDPLISSMNKGDCFILDVNQDIFVYVGEKAKNVERLKAISVANQIRDQDHNGRGRVEIIDQYSNENDVGKFFTALGSGSRDIVPEESAGGDDQTFERSEEQTVVLSEVSDSTGTLKVTPLPKPYKQEQLKPQECYILDTVSGSIYVWVGKQSTKKESSEAMNLAQQYLNAKKYPSWVHVSRIPQGTEPAAFKQYFSTWRDVGMTHTRIVRSLSDEEYYSSDAEVSAKRAKAIGKTGTARSYMPDQGDGQYTVYRIDNKVPVKIYDSSAPSSEFGVFYQNKAYLIKYEGSDDVVILYGWLGKDSAMEDRKAAAMTGLKIATEESKMSAIVAIHQGDEPNHLLRIFKGRMLTLINRDESGTKIFRVHGTKSGEDMRITQLPEDTKEIYADDVYVVKTPSQVVIWNGEQSNPDEREDAKAFADKDDVTILNGREEPALFFWATFKSARVVDSERWESVVGKRIGVEPRAFDVNLASDNSIVFQEMTDLKQRDLLEDDVYVIDVGDEIFIWIGKDASDSMRKAGYTTVAHEYMRRFNQNKLVMIIKQNSEPEYFTKLFEKWDPEMWSKIKTYEEQREAVLRTNEIDLDD